MKLRGHVVLWILLSGCAHSPSYPEQIAAMPIPRSEEDQQRLCGWLRQEEARQQSLSAASNGSQYALAFQAMARSNYAALEQKASEVPCNAAFGAVKQHPSIDQCVADCQRITAQDAATCFKTCRN